jgi:hypothetical protein
MAKEDKKMNILTIEQKREFRANNSCPEGKREYT